MKKTLVAILLLSCPLLLPSLSVAGPIKTYVAEFAVVPQDRSGLKSTLQTLLSSRLASEAITPVAAQADADVIITGSFTRLGKVFSLDSVAKLSSGKTLATVFEQGESQDDLIPALGKVSAKLKSEILQHYPQPQASAPAPKTQEPSPQAASPRGTTAWLSQRIANAQLGLAPTLTGAEGKEFVVAEPHALNLYRQEKNLKPLAKVEFATKEKVIAVDTTGPDKNGNSRVYVTILDGETPSSQIFSVEQGKFKTIATKLPYLFRAIGLNGSQRKVYAQQVGISDDFYGDLYEVNETSVKVELQNPIKLPRYANIFNYNRLSGPDGKSFPIVFSADGYLIVYSEEGEELWRSNEKFGGSETYFQRELPNVRDPSEKIKWHFLDQRIMVAANGEIIVPQNAGFFVLGNNRSYSKYSLISFSWNGSSLEENWRTKQSQNYLADFYLDAKTRELVLLEVVQKEGVFSKGGSAVRVIRAE
jgi:hypothetical protein